MIERVQDGFGDFLWVSDDNGNMVSVPFFQSEEYMVNECKYVAIFLEDGELNHYRYIGYSGALVYPPAKWKPMGLCEILQAIPEAKRHGYSLAKTLRERDEAQEWIKSYMPAKRAPISPKTRLEVYAKCNGRCAYCGKPIKISEMQVDHVDSHYRHQGHDEVGNYLPACRDCNGLKSDYLLEEFREVLIPQCAKASLSSNSRQARICKAYKLKWNKGKRITFYFERMGKEGNED